LLVQSTCQRRRTRPGPAALLSSTGYVTSAEWWRLSAIIGVIFNVIWLGGGLLWTKLLGFW
jgi:Di- and tricarboxylate transporters